MVSAKVNTVDERFWERAGTSQFLLHERYTDSYTDQVLHQHIVELDARPPPFLALFRDLAAWIRAQSLARAKEGSRSHATPRVSDWLAQVLQSRTSRCSSRRDT